MHRFVQVPKAVPVVPLVLKAQSEQQALLVVLEVSAVPVPHLVFGSRSIQQCWPQGATLRSRLVLAVAVVLGAVHRVPQGLPVLLANVQSSITTTGLQ